MLFLILSNCASDGGETLIITNMHGMYVKIRDVECCTTVGCVCRQALCVVCSNNQRYVRNSDTHNKILNVQSAYI